MRSFYSAVVLILLLCASLLAQAPNPAPLVNQPLVPSSTAPGGPGFTLTVNGTGFVSGSVVNWNGQPRSTTFIGSNQLSAAILASDIATAGSAEITVDSPPPGGGPSNVVPFLIASPTTTPGFFTFTSYVTTGGTGGVFAGDFNGDGIPDLAAAGEGSGDGKVFIFLGNGNGSFQTGPVYSTGAGWASGITGGDFNGDGKLDIAVTSINCQFVPCNPGQVSVFRGNGDGTFQLPVNYDTGAEPWNIIAADMNGDGKLDLITGNNCGYNCSGQKQAVSVLLGNGDGTFQPHIDSGLGNNQYVDSLAVGDFNRDGKLDLATVDYCISSCSGTITQETVTILLGNGDGTFQPISNTLTNFWSGAVAVADLNGDGKLDLAVTEAFSTAFGYVAIFLGNGDGTFQGETDYATGVDPLAITTGDFNGDGKLDVATSNSNYDIEQAGTVSILSGNGDGTFHSPTSYQTGAYPEFLVAADFNRDGKLDLATGAFNEVSGADVLLQSSVTFSTSLISFPYTPVGRSSDPVTVTLTNIGVQTLNIAGVAITGTDKADFSVASRCGMHLLPQASCELQVTFTPTNYHFRTAGLTISDNSAGPAQTVQLQGSGTALTIYPASLDFGDQALGTSSSQTVTLTNHGSKPVTFYNFNITGTNAHDFVHSHSCPYVLGPGSSCTVSVTFTPTAVGSRTATMNVYSTGGASPEIVNLSGTGTH